jgi:uncharacterized membrane protein
MFRTSLVYGAISGAIVIGSTTAGISALGDDGLSAFPEWLGYLIMLLALTLIFVGIKRYRDQEQGGVITFGKATLVGLGIAAVAGVVYVVAWEAYLAATDYAFIDQYTTAYVANREAEGVAGPELEAVTAEMEAMKESYANPLFRLPITFLEIFPVGLLIALLSAALLRKSTFLPASTTRA